MKSPHTTRCGTALSLPPAAASGLGAPDGSMAISAFTLSGAVSAALQCAWEPPLACSVYRGERDPVKNALARRRRVQFRGRDAEPGGQPMATVKLIEYAAASAE